MYLGFKTAFRYIFKTKSSIFPGFPHTQSRAQHVPTTKKDDYLTILIKKNIIREGNDLSKKVGWI